MLIQAVCGDQIGHGRNVGANIEGKVSLAEPYIFWKWAGST